MIVKDIIIGVMILHCNYIVLKYQFLGFELSLRITANKSYDDSLSFLGKVTNLMKSLLIFQC